MTQSTIAIAHIHLSDSISFCGRDWSRGKTLDFPHYLPNEAHQRGLPVTNPGKRMCLWGCGSEPHCTFLVEFKINPFGRGKTFHDLSIKACDRNRAISVGWLWWIAFIFVWLVIIEEITDILIIELCLEMYMHAMQTKSYSNFI